MCLISRSIFFTLIMANTLLATFSLCLETIVPAFLAYVCGSKILLFPLPLPKYSPPLVLKVRLTTLRRRLCEVNLFATTRGLFHPGEMGRLRNGFWCCQADGYGLSMIRVSVALLE